MVEWLEVSTNDLLLIAETGSLQAST